MISSRGRGTALFWGFVLLFFQQSSNHFLDALVVPLSAAKPAQSLMGVSLPKVFLDKNGIDGTESDFLDIGAELSSGSSGNGKTMVVFGTHAGDFNTIEYMQKIRASLPELQSKGGIDRIFIVVNGEPNQCKIIASLLDFYAQQHEKRFFGSRSPIVVGSDRRGGKKIRRQQRLPTR